MASAGVGVGLDSLMSCTWYGASASSSACPPFQTRPGASTSGPARRPSFTQYVACPPHHRCRLARPLCCRLHPPPPPCCQCPPPSLHRQKAHRCPPWQLLRCYFTRNSRDKRGQKFNTKTQMHAPLPNRRIWLRTSANHHLLHDVINKTHILLENDDKSEREAFKGTFVVS